MVKILARAGARGNSPGAVGSIATDGCQQVLADGERS